MAKKKGRKLKQGKKKGGKKRAPRIVQRDVAELREQFPDVKELELVRGIPVHARGVRPADDSTPVLHVHGDMLLARDEVLKRLGGIKAMAAREVGDHESMGATNIRGVGVGVKESCGAVTGDVAVKVFVREKLPSRRIQKNSEIPSQVAGLPTDVEPVEEFNARSYAGEFQRPVRCGVSCGHVNVTAGSIGSLVVLNNNNLAILSNNHVLADENDGLRGDQILQPGMLDSGQPNEDFIGRLEAFVPLKFNRNNLVDAAVALTRFNFVSPRHVTYAIHPTPIAATLYMPVIKNGRTTQVTGGWVSAIHVNKVPVNYRKGKAFFNDQIVIRSYTPRAFSLSGDSGSLVASAATKQPVGLLFAGGPTHSVANPIATVMQKLGIKRFLAPS